MKTCCACYVTNNIVVHVSRLAVVGMVEYSIGYAVGWRTIWHILVLVTVGVGHRVYRKVFI